MCFMLFVSMYTDKRDGVDVIFHYSNAADDTYDCDGFEDHAVSCYV